MKASELKAFEQLMELVAKAVELKVDNASLSERMKSKEDVATAQSVVIEILTRKTLERESRLQEAVDILDKTIIDLSERDAIVAERLRCARAYLNP